MAPDLQKWAPERPEYYVQTGGMHENPYGVPRDEIIRYILDNPPEVVAQVVFGKYVESSGLVFKGETIQMLFDRSKSVVKGSSMLDGGALQRSIAGRRFYGDLGSSFHTGVDFARQTDYTVIFTIDTTHLPARVVYFRRLNRVPWETIYGEVGRAVKLWGPNVLCDSTGPGGDVVMDALEGRFYCTKHERTFLNDGRCLDRHRNPNDCNPDEDWISLAVCDGFQFTGTTKKELVEHLRNVCEVGYDTQHPEAPFGHLRCPPIPQLEEELAFYTWDDKKLMTDCLFALALACWSGLEDPIGDAAVGSPFGD